ncbi:hypothetical protein [Nostoc sp. ChiVER01]|uniref:hypothetical protein n=1 Tax=Nostoc sp. ChiVER01 TaxID=3075382 RepID=UPI002AD243CA|nr:hypothetical protein [Nostoc sp. ChiVER01]MDZ8223296.1 hypothetical protein [Nostoc sp. ChiVER01]
MVTVTLMAVATTIATTLWTKAQEEIGKNIGHAVSMAPGKLIELLRQKNKSPLLISAVEGNEPQRLDYQAVLVELKAAADTDPEIAQAVMEVEAAAKAEPKLTQKIQEIENTLKSQQPTIQNLTQLAEKIGSVNQGHIDNQTINF